jgi:hypothetical protein
MSQKTTASYFTLSYCLNPTKTPLVLLIHDPLGSLLGRLLLLLRSQVLLSPLWYSQCPIGTWSLFNPVDPGGKEGQGLLVDTFNSGPRVASDPGVD